MNRKKRYQYIVIIVMACILFNKWGEIQPKKVKAMVSPVENGSYKVPVSLWNATKETISMGNGALEQTGKLVIEESQATLYVKLNSLVVYEMTGYLMELNRLGNIQFNEYNYPISYEKEAAKVISTYDITDSFNEIDSTDLICAGRNYPKVIAIPVDLEQEEYWIEIYVPMMGSLGVGEQACRLRIDYGQSTKMAQEELNLWSEYEAGEQGETPVSPSPSISPAPTEQPSNSQEQEKLDKDNLENGKYLVEIALWNANVEKESMGNAAVNSSALLTVKDGVYMLEISTKPMTIGTLTACLQAIYIRQEDRSYTEATITARNNKGSEPSIFQFTLPSKEEYIAVKIDPKVEIMGTDPLDARLKIFWNTLQSVEESTTVDEDTENVVSGLQSDKVKLVDKKTNIQLVAEANILPNGVRMICKKVSKANYEEETRASLEEVASEFELYTIELIDESGSTIQPKGMVQISIPVPKEYNQETVSVYRINNGMKTAMTGNLKKEKYIFSTNTIASFAVVDTSENKEESIIGNNSTDTGIKINGTAPIVEEALNNTIEEVEKEIEEVNTMLESGEEELIQKNPTREYAVQEAFIMISYLASMIVSGVFVIMTSLLVMKNLRRRISKHYEE